MLVHDVPRGDLSADECAQAGADEHSHGGSRGSWTGHFPPFADVSGRASEHATDQTERKGSVQGSLSRVPAALLHPIDLVPRHQPRWGRRLAVIRAQLIYAFRCNHRSESLELPEVASHADVVVAVDARARLENFL